MPLIVDTLRFVFKRAWYRRAILLPTVLGLLGVVTALAGVPLFSTAAANVSLQAALHAPDAALSNDLEVRLEDGEPLDVGLYQGFSTALADQAQSSLGTDLLNTPPLRAGEAPGLNLFTVGQNHLKATPLDTTDLWFSSSMNATHLRLLAGRFPSGQILSSENTRQGLAYDMEAMIAPDWATQFNLKLNDVLEVVTSSPLALDDRGHTSFRPFLRLHIVGFFQPKSLQDPVWFNDLDPFTLPIAINQPLPPAPIWLNEGVFQSVAFGGLDSVSYIWFYYLHFDAITSDNAQTVINNLIQLKETLNDPRFDPTISTIPDVQSKLDTALEDFLQQDFYTNVVILVVILPGVALLLLYLDIAASTLAEQSREELALMQSRGASRWQSFAPSLTEALLLCLATLLVAPFLAGALTLLLLQFSFFGQAPEQLNAILALPTLQAYRYAGLATLLCLLVLLLPAVRVTQTNLLTVKRRTSRPRLLSLPLRLGPGLLLTALGLYGYVEIQQRGAFFLQSLQGNNQAIDWVAVMAPTLLLVGAASLSLLLLPPALALLDHLAQRLPGVAAGLASRTLARQPGRYSRLVFLLTLTISLSIFAGLCYGTLTTNLDDRAAFQAGADLRLVEGASNTLDYERQAAPLADHLRLLGGVTDGMSAYRISDGFLPVGQFNNVLVNLLAVESTKYAQIAYWRDDFADQSLETLMGRLQQPTRPDVIPAIVSDRMLTDLGIQPGATITLEFGFGYLTLVIAGIYHDFPTFDPGGYSLVCDLSRLLALLNAPGTTQFMPNEVWLKLAPGAPQYSAIEVQQALAHSSQQSTFTVQQAYDRAAITESLRTDPLQSSISGTLTFDFLIAVLLSVAGLALLLYLIARQRVFEFGVLRVLGLSLCQLAGALSWEELTLFLSALVLGVPLGVGIAALVLPALALDENGQPLFPPIVFQLDIQQALQEGLIIFACLLAALVVTALLFRRLRVHEVLRLGEE